MAWGYYRVKVIECCRNWLKESLNVYHDASWRRCHQSASSSGKYSFPSSDGHSSPWFSITVIILKIVKLILKEWRTCSVCCCTDKDKLCHSVMLSYSRVSLSRKKYCRRGLRGAFRRTLEACSIPHVQQMYTFPAKSLRRCLAAYTIKFFLEPRMLVIIRQDWWWKVLY